MKTKLIQIENYLLLINEEAEIKEGDIVYRDTGVVFKITNERISYYREVIPKTVHKIYKCLAYYPLTEEAKELDLPLLPNPFYKKTDVVALAIEKYGDGYWAINQIDAFKEGYKAAQSKQFSLEDIKKAFIAGMEFIAVDPNRYEEDATNYIQSLSTQQLPKKFIPEWTQTPPAIFRENEVPYAILKTIINSEGKEELVGTYK